MFFAVYVLIFTSYEWTKNLKWLIFSAINFSSKSQVSFPGSHAVGSEIIWVLPGS